LAIQITSRSSYVALLRRAFQARNQVGEGVDERGAVPVLDVAQHNVDAIRLYERLGWRRVGELELDLGRPITFIAYVGPSASEA
jgi:ribosomal protein S18 acetylase RimI-like enzyme